ncbi:hypothetical protein ACQ4LE_007222 [Meloidogyne hapla]
MYLLRSFVRNLAIKRLTSTVATFPGPVLGIELGLFNSRVAIVQTEKTGKATSVKTPTVLKTIEGSSSIPNGAAWVEARGKPYMPSEICSRVLKKVKKLTDTALKNIPVIATVITAPINFNGHLEYIQEAGILADFNILGVVNGHVAAALSYFLDPDEGKVIAVCSLEYGSFVVTILGMHNGLFEVKSTAGNYSDNDISKHAASQYVQNGIPLTDALISRSTAAYKKALLDAKVYQSDVSEVLLVGEMANIDEVKQVATRIFGREPLMRKELNPEEAIAVGAALNCDILAQKFLTKEFDDEDFVLSADTFIVAEVPDSVHALEDIWCAVSYTIRVFFAHFSIDVRGHTATKCLTYFSSTFASIKAEEKLLQSTFEHAQNSHRRHYRGGLPEDICDNYNRQVRVFLEEFRNLDKTAVGEGIKPYLMEAKAAKGKTITFKDNEHLKGMKLRHVPDFYELINGVTYKFSYEAR